MDKLGMPYVVIALRSAAAIAGPLPSAKPEEVGLSTERLGRLSSVLRAEVEGGRLPGAVALVARRGRIAYLQSFGWRDKGAGTVMRPDDLFRIASMMKPLVSVAAMMLAEEGRFVLSDPVSKYIPELKQMRVAVEHVDVVSGKTTFEEVPAIREITVHDLLRHTSGIAGPDYTTNQRVKDAFQKAGLTQEITNAELAQRIAGIPLTCQPGSAFQYGRSTDILGRVVEVASGKTLGAFLKERLFDPLGMSDTGFYAPPEKVERVAQPFATDPDTKEPTRMSDVSRAHPLEAGSGAGGAVSTAADYASFLQMMLDRGTVNGQPLLSRTTISFMTADHLGSLSPDLKRPGYSFGLGFAVRTALGLSSRPASVGEFGWSGVGGTVFSAEPQEQLISILMTQRPGATRTYYTQLFRQLVQQAIVD
jgi:CubicO group peptidase (beta-lactamase class C family)